MQIVLGLPGRHIFRDLLGKCAFSWFLKRVLCLKSCLNFVIFLIIFLVFFENFRVLSQILLIWDPGSINAIFVMVRISKIEVDSAHIVVVDSMLNVLKIIVGNWHTEFEELLVDFLLRILELISQLIILCFKLLSESHLGHFIVHLGQLLHLEMVLSDQVLLLLGEVSEVLGWGPGIDLSRWHRCVFWDVGSCSDHGKTFNN
jgi:hypothetical protein